MLSWVASSYLGNHVCEAMHILQGRPPAALECPFNAFLQNWFWKEAGSKARNNAVIAPSRWVCLPYVSLQSQEALFKSLRSNQRDPLVFFAGKRDVLRRTKRTSLVLQKQTENNLPHSPHAIIHLEAQGYLCVHCTFQDSHLIYWYENPRNGWVACLKFDLNTGQLLGKEVGSGSPLFYQHFIVTGVTT